MPINGGTLGSLGVGFTEDASVITLNDDATVESTGVIATTGISFHSLTDDPCHGCPDSGRSMVD